jgi:cation diffusion facilitator family transporter
MQWVRDHEENPVRRRHFRRAALITVAGNLVLAAGKGVVAYLSGSVALYADAANSASDVVYSLLMIVGLWIAQQPPDLSHPQGHQRFEPLSGLIVAAAMTFAGYEAGRASIARLISGGLAVQPGLPMIVLLTSALIKWGMFIGIRNIAQQVNSPTLDATAKDNIADVLASGAALFGALGSAHIHPVVDAVAGILVALWIFRAAFEAWQENLAYLTGAGAPPELRDQMGEIASGIPGVQRVHQVLTEYAGPQLVVDLHINVDGNLTLFEAHRIAEEVRERLEDLPDVERAYIHVEPYTVPEASE